MTIWKQTPLKMNQNKETNAGGSGAADSKSKGTESDKKAEGAGDSTQSSAGNKEEDSSLGYEAGEEVAVGEYSADGLKTKEPKPHEKVELGYEIENLEGFSDEEVLAIKTFASKHKLSKEAAVEYVDSKKKDSLKFKNIVESQKAAYQEKVKKYKAGEVEKLKAAIGGEGGKEFKANLKKVNDFLVQHLPELKKEIDEKGVFLSANVMQNIYNLQNKLLGEEKLVTGGQKTESDDQPIWMKRYK